MRPLTDQFPRFSFGLVLLVLLASLAMFGCDQTGTEPGYTPAIPLVTAFACPESPCYPPDEDQEDRIEEAIENLTGISAVCDSIAGAALDGLNAGDFRLGDYDGRTWWSGQHPNDTYLYTEIEEGFEMWPPMYLEYIIAHEFVHKFRHWHMDKESQVVELAEECAGIG